jgi:hypothetical protein
MPPAQAISAGLSTPSWVQEEQCHSSGLRSDMRDARRPDVLLANIMLASRPKLAAFIDDSETHVLSYLDFPEQHRSEYAAPTAGAPSAGPMWQEYSRMKRGSFG